MLEKLRPCLICRGWFQSASPANRICKKCKKSRKSLRGGVECVPIASLAVSNPYRMMAEFDVAPLSHRLERDRMHVGKPKRPPPPKPTDAAVILNLDADACFA
jgi:hypothetical protein